MVAMDVPRPLRSFRRVLPTVPPFSLCLNLLLMLSLVTPLFVRVIANSGRCLDLVSCQLGEKVSLAVSGRLFVRLCVLEA